MKVVVLIPAHDEEAAIGGVLEDVARHADEVLVVNDGSTDATAVIVEAWRDRVALPVTHLRLAENRGAAAALGAGFRHLCARLEAGTLAPDDAVVTMDADGQHIAGDIPRLVEVFRRGGYDHVLGRRRLAAYPPWKRAGNAFMSLAASALARRRFRDVECGFRLLRAAVLPDIVRYYAGYRYSNGQEIAIISSLCGHRITNDCPVTIAFYRHRGAAAWDGPPALYFGLRAALKVMLRRPRRAPVEVSAGRAAASAEGEG